MNSHFDVLPAHLEPWHPLLVSGVQPGPEQERDRQLQELQRRVWLADQALGALT